MGRMDGGRGEGLEVGKEGEGVRRGTKRGREKGNIQPQPSTPQSPSCHHSQ